MTKRTLIIEGFPVYFGDAVDWHEGEAIPALLPVKEKTQIGRSIDILGGVMDWQDASFTLRDIDGQIADLFRFQRVPDVDITGPVPLVCPRDTATVNQTVTIPAALTARAGVLPIAATAGYAGVKGSKPGIYADFSAYFTVEFLFYHPGTAGIGRPFSRFNSGTGDGLGVFVDGPYLGASINANDSFSNSVFGSAGWYHAAVTFSGGNGTFFVNGAVDSYFSDSDPAPSSGLQPEYFNLSGSGLDLVFARLRVWNRALSETEIADCYLNKPVSEEGLLYYFDDQKTSVDLIRDLSPFADHKTLIAGITQDTKRAFVPGDLVYLPFDTARVTQFDPGVSLDFERQVYSAFENGYQSFYQALPYPEAVSSGAGGYVVQGSTAGPFWFSGRIVCYYVDDQLVFIGRLQEIEQNGRSWTLTTVDVLKPLRDGFKPVLAGLRLGSDWCVDYALFMLDDQGTQYSTGALTPGMLTYDDLPAALTSGGNIYFSPINAFCRSTTRADLSIVEEELTKGTIAAFTEGTVFQLGAGSFVGTRALTPVPRYGICADYEVRIVLDAGSDVSGLDDTWLQIGDVRLKIFSVDNTTKTIVARSFDKDFKHLSTWGISSGGPIYLQGAMIANAASIQSLVYSILTSSGNGDNGAYDFQAGWIGFGLPHEIVETEAFSVWNFACTADLSEAQIGQDLQALGLALVFENGLFKIRPVAAPINVLASATITDDQRLVGQLPGIKWGHFSPISQIRYATADSELTCTAWLTTAALTSDRRAKELRTGCKARLTAAQREQWLDVNFRRLQWLCNYAPVIDLVLPGHDLELLQVVALSSSVLAGQGKPYGIDSVPGLVIGLSDDYRVQVALNTAVTAYFAAWCPSLEIASYSGAVCTLVHDDAERLFERYDLPIACQIIASDGSILTAAVNIVSIDSGGQVTLSAAPTYTQTTYQGILTLPNYTSADADDKTVFVWVSNTSGSMSDSTDGKKLT